MKTSKNPRRRIHTKLWKSFTAGLRLLGMFLLIVTLCVEALEAGTRIAFWVKAHLEKNRIIDNVSENTRDILNKITHEKYVSENTFNIYYFGESTMKGEAYAPNLTIPKLVEYMLGGHVGNTPIRSVNLGEPADDVGIIQSKLAEVVERQQTLYPSFLVVMVGNNEYLKYHNDWGFAAKRHYAAIAQWLATHSLFARRMLSFFRVYKLEIDERRFFDAALFESQEYETVADAYCSGIHDMTSESQDHNIPVILSTAVGNYSQWEPNRSLYCGLPSEENRFRFLMRTGRKAQDAGNHETAIRFYEEALAICPTFAETHYRLGKNYEARGDFESAQSSYQRAVDYDGMPIRVRSAQNSCIRALPQADGVSTVDAESYFRQQAENGLIGFNLMTDGHHPNIRGYILMAELIAQKMQALYPHAIAHVRPMNEQLAEAVFTIDTPKKYYMNVARGEWFYRLATWRYNPTERLRLSEESFTQALRFDMSGYEPYLGLAMVQYLKKDATSAQRYLQEAKRRDAKAVEQMLSQDWTQSVIDRSNVLGLTSQDEEEY